MKKHPLPALLIAFALTCLTSCCDDRAQKTQLGRPGPNDNFLTATIGKRSGNICTLEGGAIEGSVVVSGPETGNIKMTLDYADGLNAWPLDVKINKQGKVSISSRPGDPEPPQDIRNDVWTKAERNGPILMRKAVAACDLSREEILDLFAPVDDSQPGPTSTQRTAPKKEQQPSTEDFNAPYDEPYTIYMSPTTGRKDQDTCYLQGGGLDGSVVLTGPDAGIVAMEESGGQVTVDFKREAKGELGPLPPALAASLPKAEANRTRATDRLHHKAFWMLKKAESLCTAP